MSGGYRLDDVVGEQTICYRRRWNWWARFKALVRRCPVDEGIYMGCSGEIWRGASSFRVAAQLVIPVVDTLGTIRAVCRSDRGGRVLAVLSSIIAEGMNAYMWDGPRKYGEVRGCSTSLMSS